MLVLVLVQPDRKPHGDRSDRTPHDEPYDRRRLVDDEAQHVLHRLHSRIQRGHGRPVQGHGGRVGLLLHVHEESVLHVQGMHCQLVPYEDCNGLHALRSLGYHRKPVRVTHDKPHRKPYDEPYGRRHPVDDEAQHVLLHQ